MPEFITKVPPIKIQGIKTKLVPFIKEIVDTQKFDMWLEPFMGSGVVGFNLASKNAVFGDTNPYVIDFYNAIKKGVVNPFSVKKFLEDEGAKLYKQGENYYYFIRDRFNSEHSPFDFLFLNRSDFNGMIRFSKAGKFNVPFGHKPERFAKAYITKICNQIEFVANRITANNWFFVCQSFEKTIESAPKNSLIYCDPPYIGRHVDYFDSWDEEKEYSLHNMLVNSHNKAILSTWDHNQYRSNEYLLTLWKDYFKTTKEHFYFIGGNEDNRNSMTEALLTNFPLSAAQPLHNETFNKQLQLV